MQRLLRAVCAELFVGVKLQKVNSLLITIFKGYNVLFVGQKKHNVHRFTLNLHSLRIMMVESLKSL